jgi:hypothetical protein
MRFVTLSLAALALAAAPAPGLAQNPAIRDATEQFSELSTTQRVIHGRDGVDRQMLTRAQSSLKSRAGYAKEAAHLGRAENDLRAAKGNRAVQDADSRHAAAGVAEAAADQAEA